jgi:hypothetical protein
VSASPLPLTFLNELKDLTFENWNEHPATTSLPTFVLLSYHQQYQFGSSEVGRILAVLNVRPEIL